MLADCHTHLDGFSDAEVGDVLERARAAGVGPVVAAGTTPESSARAVELAGRHDAVFAGVGVHPMDLTGPIDESAFGRLKELAGSTPKAVVVSEIGLDFMDGMPDRAVQYQAFREQIRLARELGRPIVFHSRESHEEALRVLREERAFEVGGAMHYFQADLATAQAAVDLGFYISLARPLLRLPYLQDAARRLPLDSIVLETDSAPQPFKSKRESWTEPRHVRDVAMKLAELQDTTPEAVAEATTRNFLNMLGPNRAVVEEYLGGGGPASDRSEGASEDEGREEEEADEPS